MLMYLIIVCKDQFMLDILGPFLDDGLFLYMDSILFNVLSIAYFYFLIEKKDEGHRWDNTRRKDTI